jgi:U4/U6.U5 tri-snRNP-associated protein 2
MPPKAMKRKAEEIEGGSGKGAAAASSKGVAAAASVEAEAKELEEEEAEGEAVKQEEEDNYEQDAVKEQSGGMGIGRIKCPYLDTVDRHVIDFDSEKLCSVTLTNMNVYVCLVCGKYFQGRGKQTPAFTHSVQAGHFVFMNLGSGRAYCLPDGYEVQDSSLLDVQRCLSPRYALEEIALLNSSTHLARDVYGTSYLPGFVGLNNLARTDYLNALLHALAHVSPFRDFWLQPQLYGMAKSNIVHLFGLVSVSKWCSM